MNIELRNQKISDDLFNELQKEVHDSWYTGKDLNFQEAVDYQKSIKKDKRFSEKLNKAKAEGITLIQPRAGVALYREHIELLKYLEDVGEADLLPTTIDSYTRNNRYEEADKGIEESRRLDRSMLNGFPAINYGVDICREVTSAVKSPVQIRHGTPDARLLTEITMAGGFTSYEGGGISSNVPYAKDKSIERTIYDWQYCDRVIGMYEEAGVTINREPYGPLTGTLVPGCVSNAVAIIESILAAAQGCKHLTVGYGQCGNLIQDVAAIKSLQRQTEAYLVKFGFNDIVVTTVLHQWMGGFPPDVSRAYGVISWGAAAAALCGVTKVIAKTPHEAMGIPTKEANAAGLKATKQVVNMLRDQNITSVTAVENECKIMEAEVDCILNKVMELGSGDIAIGTVRAFEAGVIDVPFAPSRFNLGKALPARDNDGAVRFLECGNLPFTKEIIDFHREKMDKRAKYENREVSFQMVIDDVYSIGKGFLVGRPNK